MYVLYVYVSEVSYAFVWSRFTYTEDQKLGSQKTSLQDLVFSVFSYS